ncbi:putative serine esterase Mb1866c [Sycon ciliatum]|uniref:putative serine esterase Mb1866c n=1 Tax=Sycon ciliatum TaxID=27933 RepID=UPI0031F6C01B
MWMCNSHLDYRILQKATFSVVLDKFIRTLVPAGYVVVAVDVRGTGASYGNRTTDLSSVEVDDYKEVLDWVRQQHWYNGRVGAAGVSYDGLAAGLLASHGGVDAVGMMFSPVQFAKDAQAPGGVLSTMFYKSFTIFTKADEQDRRVTEEEYALPMSISFLLSYVFGKVVAIPGHDKSEAVAQHSANWDVVETLEDFDGFASMIKMNDSGNEVPFANVGFTDAVFAKLAQSNVSITTYAGYWDRASLRSSLRLHQDVGGSGRARVVAGPWVHGGLTCFTSHSPGHGTSFPLHQDLLHFFDCHLKGKCDALQKHKETFHYFRMGDEK